MLTNKFKSTILNSNVTPADFEGWLLLRGKSKSTARQKIKDLLFFKRLNIAFNYEEFSRYIENLIVNGSSSSTLNHRISSMRTYMHFLEDKGLPFDERLSRFRFVKVKIREKGIMSIEEIDALLNLPAPDKRFLTQHNNWTSFFKCVAYTGARLGEIAKLRVEDVDFGLNVMTFRETKTGDDRTVPIPGVLHPILKERIDTVKEGYLFPNKSKGHHVWQNWGLEFRNRLKTLGIVRPNITPYSLRHSYGTRMLDTDGIHLFDVKRLLGHRQTATTETYYHFGSKRLQQVSEMDPATIKNDPYIYIDNKCKSIDKWNMTRLDFFEPEKVQKAVGEFKLALYASLKNKN